MAELISIDAGETTHSGLDLFGTPDTQTSILKTEDFPYYYLEVKLASTLPFLRNNDTASRKTMITRTEIP